jgi:multiple sugar transport system permease protein
VGTRRPTVARWEARSLAELGPGPTARSRIRVVLQPYAFITPAILLVLGVSFYPVLFAVRRSLYATRYLELGKFIGLENYTQFLGRGTGWHNIANSLVYTGASLCVALPLGFALALALNRSLPCRAAIRTVLILPWIVSQTIVALLWGWLLNPNYGPVSYLAGVWFLRRLDIYGTPEWAMAGVVLANVWQSYAFPMVLLLAALQTIPPEVVEAARVDGASAWSTFWRITVPLVRPTFLITAIMLTLHYFNMVTLVFTLTGGGPVGATETLSVRVFNEAFVFHNLGFASMVGVIIFLLNLIFSLSYIRVLQGKP